MLSQMLRQVADDEVLKQVAVRLAEASCNVPSLLSLLMISMGKRAESVYGMADPRREP